METVLASCLWCSESNPGVVKKTLICPAITQRRFRVSWTDGELNNDCFQHVLWYVFLSVEVLLGRATSLDKSYTHLCCPDAACDCFLVHQQWSKQYIGSASTIAPSVLLLPCASESSPRPCAGQASLHFKHGQETQHFIKRCLWCFWDYMWIETVPE